VDYEEIERLSKGVRLAVVDLVVGLGFLLVAATLLFDHLPVVAALVLLALWAAADLAIARRRGFSGAELWPQAVQVVVVFVFAAVLHGPRWQQVGLVLLLLALQFARNPLPPRRER
jgi:hypothetical protein